MENIYDAKPLTLSKTKAIEEMELTKLGLGKYKRKLYLIPQNLYIHISKLGLGKYKRKLYLIPQNLYIHIFQRGDGFGL